MKTLAIAFTLAVGSVPAVAQNGENGTAASGHQPNEYTLACLEAPTRDCAFSAALQTVIAEEFGVERSKILTAVARALIETGQQQQAIETLMLALDEARSVNLSLVTQQKITEIAPLLARAGDTAGALALVEELQIANIKQRALIDIAREAILAGRISDGDVALSQMTNQTRAFWQKMRLLPLAPANSLAAINITDLEAQVRSFDQPDRLYRGLVALAVLSSKKGVPEDRQSYLMEADEVFGGIISINDKALATAHRLRTMYDGGMADVHITVSYDLMLSNLSRVKGAETLQSVAELIGVVEADRGDLDAAVKRMEFFTELPDKARYLSSLRSDTQEGSLSAEMRMILRQIVDLEGVYERDLVRLQLLEGALGNGDLVLATRVIAAIEDDDNQARGLALAAPLLE